MDGVPTAVETVVVSTQHSEDVENETLRADIVEHVIKPVMAAEGVQLSEDAGIHINPTGRFVVGGPMGDAGLTGRKIIVDTYGGMGRHGGGAVSYTHLDVYKRQAAVRAIPDVMVEMPVMPGEEEEMRALLVRLDSLGVRGINLLELCFPLHNEREFRRRGFKLRRKPYKVLYNYWYAGGLPIAGSEVACLDLLRFAEEAGLSMGVHYCSLDNKNTGQVFQQNRGFLLDDGFAHSHAWLVMDSADYFLKCAKAFGKDASSVREWLASEEGMEAVEVALKADVEAPLLRSVCRAALRGGHFDYVAYGRVARVDAVSYTHLDVYKRQARSLSASSSFKR